MAFAFVWFFLKQIVYNFVSYHINLLLVDIQDCLDLSPGFDFEKLNFLKSIIQ